MKAMVASLITFSIAILLLAGGILFYSYRSDPSRAVDDSTISISSMEEQKIVLTSSAFEDGGAIPLKYTCEGENISPPLAFSGVPEVVKSLVLIMEDPDIPQAVKESAGIKVFDHWVMFNIPADTIEIPAGRPAGIEGLNSADTAGYTGPCPPSQYEPKRHRYFFKAYGLDTKLELREGANKEDVLEAMKDNVIATGTLIGVYEKSE